MTLTGATVAESPGRSRRSCGTMRPAWIRAASAPSASSVALTAAVLLATALVYTSFAAGRDELTASQLLRAGPARAVLHPRRHGAQRLGALRRAACCCSACATPSSTSRCRCATRASFPTPSARAGRCSSPCPRAGRELRRPAGLADHEVPVEVPGRQRLVLMAGGSLIDGADRARAADPRPRRARSTGSAPRSTAPAAARREWVDSGRRAVYALAGADDGRLRDPRGGLPALGLLLQRRRRHTPRRPRRRSTRPPRRGPRRRARCCCGSGCSRCGRA